VAVPSDAYRRASLGAVSNVLETRNRLLLEYFEKLADQCRDKKSITPAELEEQILRLLTGVVMLLRLHEVNKQGQCRVCGWPRRTWRLWHRRPRCTVYRSLDFTMKQPLGTVWGRLLEDHKRK
jgi:hypothetical protein